MRPAPTSLPWAPFIVERELRGGHHPGVISIKVLAQRSAKGGENTYCTSPRPWHLEQTPV